MQLTETFVKQVAPPTPTATGKAAQAFYRDAELIGFGLRVASGGAKSWILERRIRGKVKRISLGRCDAIDLDQAKARAMKLIKEIERENAPRIINGKCAANTISLQEVFSDYLDVHPELSELTLKDYRRSMQGPLHEWSSTPIREISETDIVTKHQSYRGKDEARCNNAMRLLRAVLNYARLNLISETHKPIIRTNPVDVLNAKQLWYKTNKKQPDNYIQPEQLRAWWRATLQLRKTTTRDYLQFLLLTGLPPALVSRLSFNDVQFEHKTIKIKKDTAPDSWLTLPLTKHLSKQLHDRALKCTNIQDYIYPGTTPDKAISDPRTAIQRVSQLSGIRFSLKDLQCTFMHLVESSHTQHGLLTILSGLCHHNDASITENDANVLREIMEGVSMAIFDLLESDE